MILNLLSGINYAIKVIINIGYTCTVPACENITTGLCNIPVKLIHGI